MGKEMFGHGKAREPFHQTWTIQTSSSFTNDPLKAERSQGKRPFRDFAPQFGPRFYCLGRKIRRGVFACAVQEQFCFKTGTASKMSSQNYIYLDFSLQT